MKLKVYQDSTLIKTYDLTDYEYYRIDKRIEKYAIDTQVNKYVSAIYRPEFHFKFGNMDLDILAEWQAYEDGECDFVLQTGGKSYSVILNDNTQKIYHPASSYTAFDIVFTSTKTYVSPDLDVSAYTDTILYSEGFSGTQTVYFIAYDIYKLHILADADVNIKIYNGGVKYGEGNGTEVDLALQDGVNKMEITGTVNYLTAWGE